MNNQTVVAENPMKSRHEIKSNMAKVEIINEVPQQNSSQNKEEWHLCFQQCVYHYDDGEEDDGYRFIWRRPDGSLQAARGQARIGSAKDMLCLMCMAKDAGWFNFNYKLREFVIISGKQNAGKTTTAWLVYQRLRAYSEDSHLYIDGQEIENYGEIIYADELRQYPKDFKATLHINGQKIDIISAGDFADWLDNEVSQSLEYDADLIILPLRAYDRSGSSRRMLQTNYPMYRKKQFWVERSGKQTNTDAILNYKRPTADKIVNYVLTITDVNN